MKEKFKPNYEVLKNELEKTFVIEEETFTEWLNSLGLVIDETFTNGEISLSVINENEMKSVLSTSIKLGTIPDCMTENEYLQQSHEILERELAPELEMYIEKNC